jgi:deoxyribodipyrimidine photolyase-related protein
MPIEQPLPDTHALADRRMRHLVIVLGDQLNTDSHAFDDFDPATDRVWMAERTGESNHVWSTQPRSALFLAAMRHFAADLAARFPLTYTRLSDPGPADLLDLLARDLDTLRPQRVIVVRPGEHRLREGIKAAATRAGAAYAERPDRHFLCSTDDFAQWARGKTQLRMEHFYRWMRQRHGILLDGKKPVGGKWNFDQENRGNFGRAGPGWVQAPRGFAPDELTRGALDDVTTLLADHPGDLAAFDWPVTRDEALVALVDFLDHRLPAFGHWQDAMWSGEPYLYHARLSSCLNLRLLSPDEVIAGALSRYDKGEVGLASVEGFVRQILGWREFVRGVYWLSPARLLASNALDAHEVLPDFYWTGDTDMACLRDVVTQTLRTGYAHHIQRLMVTGNFALLLGVEPRLVHEWYLAVYVDAIEWVEAPNTLGMSQFADGGRMVSKPYAASGRYIERMSDYCTGCRFDPGDATSEKACPFTTLYWDFLDRHRERFWNHPRAAMQWRSLDRVPGEKMALIRERARRLRAALVPTRDA